MFGLREAILVTSHIFLTNSVVGDGVEETLPEVLPELLRIEPSPPLVFGILTQPFHEDEGDIYDEHDNREGQFEKEKDYNHTYVAASYVKWLEDGGARSIPIPFDASASLVEDILGQVDGVLFPGGGSPLPSSAINIWQLLHSEKYYYSVEENGLSDRIPLWGTCLGMEFIVQLAAGSIEKEHKYNVNRSILEDGYDSSNISLPLLNVDRTGLYHPDYIYDIVTGYNVTMNNHHLGISPQRFRNNFGLSRRFDITSINYDRNGKPFVSTIEPSKRSTRELPYSTKPPPVYGVQYHPEKNTHEYGFYPHTTDPYEAIDHSPEGITFSHYEAKFLVNLARENVQNKMQSTKINGVGRSKNQYLNKYNKPDLYPLIYTYPRKVGYKFEEQYIIPRASHWKHDLYSKTSAPGNNDVVDKGENLASKERDATNSMLRRKVKDI